MIENCSEIDELKQFIAKYAIVVRVSSANFSSFIEVELQIRNEILKIYVQDEYQDLKLNNPILNVILALRELAQIDDSEDYLQWTTWCCEDATNMKLLDYYKTTCSKLHIVKNLFPNKEIDYFISDLDFELNSGCVQYLRDGLIS